MRRHKTCAKEVRPGRRGRWEAVIYSRWSHSETLGRVEWWRFYFFSSTFKHVSAQKHFQAVETMRRFGDPLGEGGMTTGNGIKSQCLLLSLIRGGTRASQIPSLLPPLRSPVLPLFCFCLLALFPPSREPFGLSSESHPQHGREALWTVKGTFQEEQQQIQRTCCGNGFCGNKEDDRGEAGPGEAHFETLGGSVGGADSADKQSLAV